MTKDRDAEKDQEDEASSCPLSQPPGTFQQQCGAGSPGGGSEPGG